MHTVLTPTEYLNKYLPRYNTIIEETTKLLDTLIVGSTENMQEANELLNNIINNNNTDNNQEI